MIRLENREVLAAGKSGSLNLKTCCTCNQELHWTSNYHTWGWGLLSISAFRCNGLPTNGADGDSLHKNLNEIRASCSWLSSTSFRHCAMHCSNCIVLKAGSCQKSHSKLGKPSYTGGPLEGGRFSFQKTRWIVVKFETARLAQSHLIAMAMCNALLSAHLISNVGSDQNQQNLREETWNKFTHSGVHWNGRH